MSISHQAPTAKLLLVDFTGYLAGDKATIYYGGSDDSFTLIRCMSPDPDARRENVCTGLSLSDSQSTVTTGNNSAAAGAGGLFLDWLRFLFSMFE